MFHRMLLAASVAAVFAVPTIASADTAPASSPSSSPVPTMGQILNASGITTSGYFDVIYNHANRDLQNGFCDRVADCQNNNLALHQFGLQVAKQPKEGFGWLVNVTAGLDAKAFESYPFNTAGSGYQQVDLTQAYGQYAHGPVTVMAGKFTAIPGMEVIWQPSNANTSRSLLYTSEPFTETGVRVNYALNDSVTLIGGVINGWDQVSGGANGGKTVELAATVAPLKSLNFTISDYNGKMNSAVGGFAGTTATIGGVSNVVPTGDRNLLNLVVNYTPIDPLTLGLDYVNVSQKNFGQLLPGTVIGSPIYGNPITAKYDGFALYATYMFTPKWRLALRAENLNDQSGFHFGTADTTYREATATLSWLESDSFELRGEVRGDHASNPVFTVPSSGALSKTLTTYAIEGLYKF
ncbi:putative porin [Burkholderiales bacterium GJ-E10]|nr:putative porin [Burkholderiales bacterium GJ-E10]